MHWGPLKSAYQERGMGPGSMEPWDHRAMEPSMAGGTGGKGKERRRGRACTGARGPGMKVRAGLHWSPGTRHESVARDV